MASTCRGRQSDVDKKSGNVSSKWRHRSEENATATENAVAALGKILEHQPNVLDAQQSKALADTWVQALPILEDAVEAVQVHAQLVRFIEKSDARLDHLLPYNHKMQIGE
jgi:hypothetical protein